MVHHHYAFHITESEFDEIFGRVQTEGIPYGSGPHEKHGDMQISRRADGGRRVYFDEINGHSIELMTTR